MYANKTQLIDRLIEMMSFQNFDFDDNIINSFDVLGPMTRSEIFEALSHCFCESIDCDLYKACKIDHWVVYNKTLLDVEIPFFIELFDKVPSIVNDLDSYDVDEFGDEDDIDEVSGCCHDERLKQLNTVVENPEWFYDF